MHVADLTLFFAPHSGGVKRYLLAKRRWLQAQSGMRHSLLVPGPREREIEPGWFDHYGTEIPGGAGYRIPWSGWRWRRTLLRLAPDVIEVADPYHLGWFARGAADRLGVPLIAFAHSDLAGVLGARGGPALAWLTREYLRRFYRRFDLVLAPSRVIADRLTALGVAAAVQPLGVDADVFHPRHRASDLRRELELAPDTRLLVFAGRMGREKQIGRLIAALARLGAPYHLLLIGGERRVRLTSQVTLLPYEADSVRLARLLGGADALLHAGVHETFGLVVLEAMACGLPAIGVNAGAVAELIDDDVGVLAPDARIETLCESIAHLYTRDRAALGCAARARVERDYTWERTFSALLDHYRHARREAPAGAAVDRPAPAADAP